MDAEPAKLLASILHLASLWIALSLYTAQFLYHALQTFHSDLPRLLRIATAPAVLPVLPVLWISVKLTEGWGEPKAGVADVTVPKPTNRRSELPETPRTEATKTFVEEETMAETSESVNTAYFPPSVAYDAEKARLEYRIGSLQEALLEKQEEVERYQRLYDTLLERDRSQTDLLNTLHVEQVWLKSVLHTLTLPGRRGNQDMAKCRS